MAWTNDIAVFATAGAAVAAIAIPITAFMRRPRLWIAADTDGIQTRLEAGDIPWVRLLVVNRRRRRAAQGTRVFVEHYRTGADPPISMGSPELGWPSAERSEGAGVVVFAGATRPIDFGHLTPVRRQEGEPIVTLANRDQILRTGGSWELDLALAMHGNGLLLADRRELLPPTENGYTVRLLIGADDGAARIYDVGINWDRNIGTPRAALESIQLTVREVRRASPVAFAKSMGRAFDVRRRSLGKRLTTPSARESDQS